MYALVDILGKQYKVEQGSVLKVDHVVQDKGSAIEFPSVLMVSDGETSKIGNPYVSGVSVRAVVEDHGRERKLVFGKYKKKKNYRRRYGHRQQYSLIKVEGFSGIEGAAPAAKAEARTAETRPHAAPHAHAAAEPKASTRAPAAKPKAKTAEKPKSKGTAEKKKR